MENASKALIIAGAILLSILIIGLGMAVYNNASATQGKADLSATEISAFNSQFEAYEGRIKGTQVRVLLNTIKKSNKDYPDRPITVAGSAGFSEGSANDVVNTSTYEVSFDYDDNNLLNTATIDGYNGGGSSS